MMLGIWVRYLLHRFLQLAMLHLAGSWWTEPRIVLVVAHDYTERDHHMEFDVVVLVFFFFICCMYGLHFYLKRKERQNFDLNYLGETG